MLFASFYEPDGIFDSTFNKIAAKLTGGKYCHSDFIFKWTEDEVEKILEKVRGISDIRENYKEYIRDGYLHVCVHIYWGDAVGYRVLIPNHINNYWSVPESDMKTIDCTWEEELKVFQWCISQLGKKYDYFGALTYFFRPLACDPSDYNKFYCSMFMVKALQQIDKLEKINPRAVIPNKLYSIL